MAVTASLALSLASVQAGGAVSATLTLTNSGSASLYATSIQPALTPYGLSSQSVSGALAQPAPGLLVPGNGSASVTFAVRVNAPNGPTSLTRGAQRDYGVSALAYLSDGTTAAASPALLTVGDPFHVPQVD